MNYIQKNKKNIIIAIISLFLVATTIALYLQRKNKLNNTELIVAAYPSNLKVGDSLNFENNTKFTKSIRWDFGDGFTSDKEKGIHFFKKPGFYQVTVLIDNKHSKTFPILVSNNDGPPQSPQPTIIDAPSEAMQLSNIVFRAVSTNGKEFLWRFGETGSIDSNEKMAIYSYTQPGDYVVKLYTDEQAEPILHQIRIKKISNPIESDPVVNNIIPEDISKKIDDDFKYRLQQIALGRNFNENYTYLLRTYLCNKDNTQVIINDNKQDNFYYYCTGLQFDKNFQIESVKTTLDNNENCVIKVDVKQNK